MYFGKSQSGLFWVLGNSPLEPGLAGTLIMVPLENNTKVEFREPTGKIKFYATLVTEIKRPSNDTPYANYNELLSENAYFFATGAVGPDGYVYLPNATTGLRVRLGQRTGFVWAVDQELTVGGFSGAEGVGWENVTGNQL